MLLMKRRRRVSSGVVIGKNATTENHKNYLVQSVFQKWSTTPALLFSLLLLLFF
eukprot:gene1853-1132_t